MEKETIAAIIISNIALKKVNSKEAVERIKNILFEHNFVESCFFELEEAKKFRPSLDTTTFIMGFVAGAKIATILEKELLFDKSDPD